MTATIMRAAAGRTVVLVSHRPGDVDLADDVYDLIDGRLSLRD